ncbi:MAG: UvrD-helicase domain-containing protein [Microcella pacifica]|uniref:UvrD-helicase domain-containing protein n=1 Tax=Microcella pacifica TaxID=2591847 RepID=UPI0033161190
MTPLKDAAARDIIDTTIDETVFVEAGAGVGKTHHLVRRILRLIGSGIPVTGIAAITFTEKAAAELRDRVRTALTDTTTLESDRRDAALDDLDSAPIGTIHSFAARVLEQCPIEAGLPPGIEVIDELRAGIAFAERWRRARTALFADPDCAIAMDVLLSAGVTLGQLESVARALDDAWDRVRDAPTSTPAPVHIDLTPLVRLLQSILDRRVECRDPDDKLLVQFPVLQSSLESLRAAIASGEVSAQVDSLFAIKRPTLNRGAKANWADLEGVKDQLRDLEAEQKSAIARIIDAAIGQVVASLGGSALREADARRQHGTLEFHDLLIVARDLFAGQHAAEAHRRMHEAYPRILLDEFQDTDPLQAELAVRIAADDVVPVEGWLDSVTPPGQLFMVGDPKQSIYRFRRADIATYLEQGERVTQSPGGRSVSMTTNFRSTRPVLDWVNDVFGTLIVEDGHAQPHYTPLTPDPDRPAWDDRTGGPAVVLVEATEAEKADQIKQDEAAGIASAVLRAVGRHPEASGDAWLVEHKNRETDQYEQRPARLGDVCILLPSRTALPALEAALDDVGLDFVAESSSLVYSTREVSDLLLAVRAIANVADEAALVIALRSPLFACGDDDLMRWRAGGGRWAVDADAPTGLESGPVAEALRYLSQLLRDSRSLSPAVVLERLVRDRHVRQAVLDSPRYRDVWRRIRFMIDQAQAWSEATHGSLREYLDWAELQQDEKARVTERSVPEEDLDAVRITTIHQSKGREFPIVALHGMGSGWSTSRPSLLWTPSGEPLVSFSVSNSLYSSGYPAAYELEKTFLNAERVRLLYVACTRAESHLIVSGFTASRGASWGRILHHGLEAASLDPLDVGIAPRTQRERPRAEVAPVGSWSEWLRRREQWQAVSAQPSTMSVTGMAHGGDDPFVPQLSFADPEGDPALRERRFGQEGGSGSELGTAVHRVLELSDLAADADIDAIALDVARAASIDDHALLAAMARSALASEPVARAARLEHWLELPVAAVRDLPGHGSIIVEGVADLVYRETDGSLVIVDFKTDQGVAEESVTAYWTQLNAYADLIAAASGQRISGLALVFCRDSPATVLRKVPA